MPHDRDADRDMLRRASRLAVRGHGGAEPNPLVGCLIASAAGDIVGSGFHRQCGQAHAEIHALRAAGERARGATAFVTLEPCNHTGRTGPCTEALIAAGIARIVIGRRDPHPLAAGGAERLRDAGIRVDIVDDDPLVTAVSDPFVRRLATGLPWVVAKWAQTLDGRIATRTGVSRWISGERSRRLVHRERGRVDAILTGIGTVFADDPMLTARDVPVRRIARRVIVDPKLQIPLETRLVTTARQIPTTIACRDTMLAAADPRAGQLADAGVELIGLPHGDEPVPLAPLLRMLVARHDVTNVLVEAGAGLLGALFHQRLVNEAWVFIAPLLLGDDEAMPAVRGLVAPGLADAARLRLVSKRQRGEDIVLRYRVGDEA